ncbi:hypothetical protein [Ottowia sp.]|uniref:hypothetical protein n=1 Tax=Ottowia sp. TaxID=1898956 RepID=UPI0025D9DBAB|nr:hypothetical protein [Ottowia sp.]MBK6616105.1 hypothetical protein [Ottowia sp.]
MPTIDDLAKIVARRQAQERFRSLVIYAKLLGLRYDIRVVFDPTMKTAATDGNTVWLRPLEIGDEEDAVLIEALIDHECGVHCRMTDFDLLNDRLATASDLLSTLQNVFEDVWGERELKKVKPGCARAIASGVEIMVKRGIFGPPKPDAHVSSLLIGGLVTGLRSQKLGQTILEPFHVQRWEMLRQKFGSELAGKIWDASQDVDQCFSTGAAIDLAERITALMKDFTQQEPPANKSPQSGPGQPNPQQGKDNSPDPSKSNDAGTGQQQPTPGQPDPDSGKTPDQAKNDGNDGSQPGQDTAEPKEGSSTPSTEAGKDEGAGKPANGNDAGEPQGSTPPSDSSDPQDSGSNGEQGDESSGGNPSGQQGGDGSQPGQQPSGDGESNPGSSPGSATPEAGKKGPQGNQPADGQPQAGEGSGQPAGDPKASKGDSGNKPASSAGPSASAPGDGNQAPAPAEPGQQRSSVSKPTPGADDKKEPGAPASGDPAPSGQPAVPSAGPDQNPIQSVGKNDDNKSQSPGPAAPQPADMTPEEFRDAVKAVQATLAAKKAESGSGELADAMANAITASTASQDAAKHGISAGNQWRELESAKLDNNEAIDQLVTEISRPVAVRLGSRLDSLLEAQTTSNSEMRRQGRRLGSAALVKLVASGNPRVFRRSDDTTEIDTVLHCLTDISGSMNAPLESIHEAPQEPKERTKATVPTASAPSAAASTQTPAEQALKKGKRTLGHWMRATTRIGAAAAVTRALGDVLNRFTVPFAVSYFGGCLTNVKGYEDSWRIKRSLYWEQLEGNTCTDQALIGIIPELAARVETRKVLLLATDGVPAHAQAAVLALSEARKLGIDVCVVLITSSDDDSDVGLAAFKREMDNWGIPYATATAVEELAQAVFDAVKQAF